MSPPLDFRENLIVDQNNPILIQKAWRDHDCAGWAYLGAPHGEDALTWNVFRSLDKPPVPTEWLQSRAIVQRFFGLESELHELLFWGCNPDGMGDAQQKLNISLRTLDGKRKGTMTEPDLVLITSTEVCFVECKLSFTPNPWSASERRTLPSSAADGPMEDAPLEELSGWRKRWMDYRGDPMVASSLPSEPSPQDSTVYQLIRNAIYARRLRDALGKSRAVVASLISRLQPEFYPSTLTSYEHFRHRCEAFAEVRKLVFWEDLKESVPRNIASRITDAIGGLEVRAPEYVARVIRQLRSGVAEKTAMAEATLRSLSPARLSGHAEGLVKCLAAPHKAELRAIIVERLASLGEEALPALRTGLCADRVNEQLGSIEVLHRCPRLVGSSRVDLQACKLEYSIVSPK